jgi:pyruvate kinase
MNQTTRSAACALLLELQLLRMAVETEASQHFATWAPLIQRPEFRPGAHNLACYIALRHRDLRPLQRRLAHFGLSSLGRLEGRVLGNLDAVARALSALAGKPPAPDDAFEVEDYDAGQVALDAATELLLGPPPSGRRCRLMVTMPGDAADNVTFLRDCIRSGMQIARINCAHDAPDAWAAIARSIRALAREEGRDVRILMDIAGPKSRIEAVRFAPKVERISTGDRVLLVRRKFRPVDQWPAQFSIGIPEAVAALVPGNHVWIDDGKLGCVVEQRDGKDAALRIVHAPAKGVRLKVEKGVNFPDVELAIPALTDKDRQDLAIIASLTDMIGYSFVQSEADIDLLQAELARHRPRDWTRIGVVAKIETLQGVRNLPDIIVAAGGRQPLGVMIARGDLAVELGFERLAEMQEELLWICEAARVPVIWATQVLEGYVKKGAPSRGEMTDAAMAGRAECVMLNKGPNTVQALQLLDRLLNRMAEHQIKKTAQLRALHSW